MSPVFDSAQTLLIAQIENSKVIQTSYESFDSSIPRFLGTLKKLDVSVLICGAISEVPATIITSSGIKLIPFVTGNTAQVLNLYLSNKPVPPVYFMPGCRRQGCRNGLKTAAINVNEEVSPMPGKDRTGPIGRGKGQGPGKGRGCGQKKGSGQGGGQPGQGGCPSGQGGGQPGKGRKPSQGRSNN